MRGNGFALISVLLLISLALIGFAYAHWEEIITVEGEVSTGKVDARIIDCYCNDKGNDPGYDKDVASCVCSITGSQKADVTITNAYPCYNVSITLVVKNTGTIPIALGEVRVDGNIIPDQKWTPIDLDGDGYDIEFYVIPGGSADPNGYITTTLMIHIMEDANQDTTYTFTIEFEFRNWNEVQ